MDIVFEFPRALDARVEGLGAIVPGRPVRFQEAASRGGQPDGVIARAGDACSLDQPLLAQVAQVARAWVHGRAAGVEEITTGDHSERADGCEGTGLGTPQRVLAATGVVHDFAFQPARQVHMPLEYISRWTVAVTLMASRVSLSQVHDAFA
jgi:hypothetical protein